MERILIKETINKAGEKVKIAGWANVVRRQGKIVFIDLRDKSGVLQCVFALPSGASAKEGAISKEAYELAQTVRSEWVLEIEGEVIKRPEKMVNPKIETGSV